MTRYAELCQTFALARQASQQAMETCDQFVELFLRTMGDYLGCPVELQNVTFDEQGAMHFYPAIKLYADPDRPDDDAAEIVVVSVSLERLTGGFLVTLFPWEEGFEIVNEQLHNLDHFAPIFDFIVISIKNEICKVFHHKVFRHLNCLSPIGNDYICEQIITAYQNALVTPRLETAHIRNLGWDF